MNIFIVDTNVIFSACLNIENSIGKFIMSANPDRVKFFAPDYLKIEIERHFDKIVRISNRSEAKIRRILDLLYLQINFISDSQIPYDFYHNALRIVRDIDVDDVVFVALTDYLDELLWTGDIELYNELKAKGYDKVCNFEEVKKLMSKL